MDASIIINFVLAVLAVVIIFVGYYLYIRSKLLKAVAGAIDDAEQDDKTGEEKRALAVEQICALIPLFLKPIFSKKVVEGIVQSAFDKIEDYAKKQVKKKNTSK